MFGQGDIVLERFHQRNFLSFDDAKEASRLMGIKTSTEYRALRKSGKISVNFPPRPEDIYEQWTSWPDFLGKNGYLNAIGNRRKNSVYQSYEDAKRTLAPLKIKGWSGWRKFRVAERPLDIPYSPNEFYQKKGWVNMNDFLSAEK